MLERGLAALAEVGAAALRDRVQVAAAAAQLRAIRRQRLLLARLRNREDHLVDEISRALVVDDAPWTELGDRQEAGTLDELVTVLPAPPLPGDHQIGRAHV